MRKFIFIYIFASLIVFTNTTIGYSQPVTWVKTFSDPVKDMSGVSVVQTYDGGYAVLSFKGAISNDSKMILLKLNYLGNLQWFRYPADTIINISPIKLVQTNDSGFVMLGNEYQVGDFLLKTDKYGNFLWRKNYPDTALADARLYSFTKNLDNGFILCGNYTSFNPPLEMGYLMKTDSVGNVKWQRGYYDSTSNNYFDVIQFTDSNFYVAGYTSNSASNRYAITKKIKNNGDIIWTKLLLNPSGAGLLTRVLSDKIAVCSGLQSYGYYISLLDTSSNIIWQNYYNYPDQLFSLNSISNGSIIISGFVLQGSSIGVNKLSLSGGSTFSKTFLHPGYSLIGTRSTAITEDNGFIITGGATVNNKSNILIIKTDSSFNAPIIANISYHSEIIPNSFELFQNYPNPFNPTTSIKFNIPKNGFIKIIIYDMTGKEILNFGNQFYLKGFNKFLFDANKYNLSSGIYLLVVEFKEQIKSNKLVYLK